MPKGGGFFEETKLLGAARLPALQILHPDDGGSRAVRLHGDARLCPG